MRLVLRSIAADYMLFVVARASGRFVGGSLAISILGSVVQPERKDAIDADLVEEIKV